MSFSFPYKFARLKTGLVPYPIVTVFLKTKSGRERFDFIVDTGADMTTLPFKMIQILGLKKSELRRSEARGIGRRVTSTWEGKISIIFCQKKFTIRCSFTDNNYTPLLLGKTDIFKRFDFYFDNRHNKLVVKPI